MSGVASVEWLTIEDAARELWPGLKARTSLVGQLLQLCIEGKLTLSLRLRGANGTPWDFLPSGPNGMWWKNRFRRRTADEEVVALDGVFDLALESGGSALLEAIRQSELELPARPSAEAAICGPIKVISDDGATFGLLQLAREHGVQIGSQFREMVIDGIYALRTATWPLNDLLRAEPVVRSIELRRLARAADDARAIAADTTCSSNREHISKQLVIHSTRGKRTDVLTAVVRRAVALAGAAADTAAVWVSLEQLAAGDDPPAPLVGVVPSRGIKYTVDGKFKVFSRRALADRLRRAKPREASLVRGGLDGKV